LNSPRIIRATKTKIKRWAGMVEKKKCTQNFQRLQRMIVPHIPKEAVTYIVCSERVVGRYRKRWIQS
jgi:hypothetical protein